MALTSDRSLGYSEGPIPFSSIDRFAQRYGMHDIEQFDEFRVMITALDREYLDIRAQQAADADSDSGKQKSI
jgi:hypothetical protein